MSLLLVTMLCSCKEAHDANIPQNAPESLSGAFFRFRQPNTLPSRNSNREQNRRLKIDAWQKSYSASISSCKQTTRWTIHPICLTVVSLITDIDNVLDRYLDGFAVSVTVQNVEVSMCSRFLSQKIFTLFGQNIALMGIAKVIKNLDCSL